MLTEETSIWYRDGPASGGRTRLFVNAIKKARSFTRPVIISSRRANGRCEAAIGAFVVVNKDGWAVTAHHIIELAERRSAEARDFHDTEAKRAAIRDDQTLNSKERSKRLRVFPKADQSSVTHTSAWWAWDGTSHQSAKVLAAVDLAFVKLEPFDPEWVPEYPVFRKPEACGSEQGRSLCRIGFPFHSIEPVYHPDKNAFELPPGTIPPPFFPNDGLFTRVVRIDPPPEVGATIPLRFIETSSPGLRGQSGGPIFDADGRIWGIQSRTGHFPLGFSPPVPGRPNEKEHQFLNVGLGIHVETVVAAMRELGISFEISPD